MGYIFIYRHKRFSSLYCVIALLLVELHCVPKERSPGLRRCGGGRQAGATVLSRLVCRCELNDCSERVRTTNFLSATVLSCRESNSHRRSGRDADKTVLSCLVWRCEWRGLVTSNKCIAVRKVCHTATGTHMPHATRCYLPPGRGDIPALTPAEAGTRLSEPGGMQGWVDLVGLLHT